MRARETITITSGVQPTGLMDVPGYVNRDKLMGVPVGFVYR